MDGRFPAQAFLLLHGLPKTPDFLLLFQDFRSALCQSFPQALLFPRKFLRLPGNPIQVLGQKFFLLPEAGCLQVQLFRQTALPVGSLLLSVQVSLKAFHVFLDLLFLILGFLHLGVDGVDLAADLPHLLFDVLRLSFQAAASASGLLGPGFHLADLHLQRILADIFLLQAPVDFHDFIPELIPFPALLLDLLPYLGQILL